MSVMDKEKARQAALAQIKKEYGDDAIMELGKQNRTADVDVISTGSLALDIALGVQGLPTGRIFEFFGPESSGKTTIALHAIAEAHKKSKDSMCAIIDTEHALDPIYARNIGVDLSRLYISQPGSAEQALEIMDTLVRSGGFDVVVLDSVAALVPKAELDGDMGDSHMGLQARLMSQALRKLTGSISKSKTAVIFINQIRQKIGVMFGNPETTTGGNALKFYASVRLDVRRVETLKDKEGKPTGNKVRIKVIKNKVGTPFQSADLTIVFGKGIDRLSEILELGAISGIFEKAGSWYSYKGQKIGQGKDAARQWLHDNPKIAQEAEDAIKANAKNQLFIQPDAVSQAEITPESDTGLLEDELNTEVKSNQESDTDEDSEEQE